MVVVMAIFITVVAAVAIVAIVVRSSSLSWSDVGQCRRLGCHGHHCRDCGCSDFRHSCRLCISDGRGHRSCGCSCG